MPKRAGASLAREDEDERVFTLLHAHRRALRRDNVLPVTIMNSHARCLEILHACVRLDLLPFAVDRVVHVDAHPDLVVPTVSKSVYEVPDDFYRFLETHPDGIAAWLWPFLHQGHTSRVVWAKPVACDQLEEGERRFRVGWRRARNDGLGLSPEVRDAYFLDEPGTVVEKEEDLEDARPVELTVVALETAPADWLARVLALPERGLPERGLPEGAASWVLDVCLDTFAVVNPFFEKLKAALGNDKEDLAERVRRAINGARHLRVRGSVGPQSPENKAEETLLRATVLPELWRTGRPSDPALLARLLDDDPAHLASLLEAAEILKKASPEKLALVDEFVANAGLPHAPAPNEPALRAFAEALRRASDHPPRVVTVARSDTDEYTPTKWVDELEERVLEAIEAAWGKELFVTRAD